MATSPETQTLASFYTHLITHDKAFSTNSSQEKLSIRLRDVLFKLISLVGGPQVLSVLMPLAEAEGDVASKSKESTLNDKWYAFSKHLLAILSCNPY